MILEMINEMHNMYDAKNKEILGFLASSFFYTKQSMTSRDITIFFKVQSNHSNAKQHLQNLYLFYQEFYGNLMMINKIR